MTASRNNATNTLNTRCKKTARSAESRQGGPRVDALHKFAQNSWQPLDTKQMLHSAEEFQPGRPSAAHKHEGRGLTVVCRRNVPTLLSLFEQDYPNSSNPIVQRAGQRAFQRAAGIPWLCPAERRSSSAQCAWCCLPLLLSECLWGTRCLVRCWRPVPGYAPAFAPAKEGSELRPRRHAAAVWAGDALSHSGVPCCCVCGRVRGATGLTDTQWRRTGGVATRKPCPLSAMCGHAAVVLRCGARSTVPSPTSTSWPLICRLSSPPAAALTTRRPASGCTLLPRTLPPCLQLVRSRDVAVFGMRVCGFRPQ